MCLKFTVVKFTNLIYESQILFDLFTSVKLFTLHLGLCGNFDGNENNDFRNPQDMIEINEIAFVNTWKVITKIRFFIIKKIQRNCMITDNGFRTTAA